VRCQVSTVLPCPPLRSPLRPLPLPPLGLKSRLASQSPRRSRGKTNSNPGLGAIPRCPTTDRDMVDPYPTGSSRDKEPCSIRLRTPSAHRRSWACCLAVAVDDHRREGSCPRRSFRRGKPQGARAQITYGSKQPRNAKRGSRWSWCWSGNVWLKVGRSAEGWT
jgi:hypothetical protein